MIIIELACSFTEYTNFLTLLNETVKEMGRAAYYSAVM